jgi:AcrR family transcriptional regulator
VIAAAIELGPQATLSSIAARAGVGAASLHRYFPTTAAIFAEVSRQTYRTLLAQVRALLARTDIAPRDMVHEVCRLALQGPGLTYEHRRRLNLEIPLAWSIDAVEPIYAEIIGELAGWASSRLPTPPEYLHARLFVAFGAVRGVVLMGWLFPSMAPSQDEALAIVTQPIWEILTAR